MGFVKSKKKLKIISNNIANNKNTSSKQQIEPKFNKCMFLDNKNVLYELDFRIVSENLIPPLLFSSYSANIIDNKYSSHEIELVNLEIKFSNNNNNNNIINNKENDLSCYNARIIAIWPPCILKVYNDTLVLNEKSTKRVFNNKNFTLQSSLLTNYSNNDEKEILVNNSLLFLVQLFLPNDIDTDDNNCKKTLQQQQQQSQFSFDFMNNIVFLCMDIVENCWSTNINTSWLNFINHFVQEKNDFFNNKSKNSMMKTTENFYGFELFFNFEYYWNNLLYNVCNFNIFEIYKNKQQLLQFLNDFKHNNNIINDNNNKFSTIQFVNSKKLFLQTYKFYHHVKNNEHDNDENENINECLQKVQFNICDNNDNGKKNKQENLFLINNDNQKKHNKDLESVKEKTFIYSDYQNEQASLKFIKNKIEKINNNFNKNVVNVNNMNCCNGCLLDLQNLHIKNSLLISCSLNKIQQNGKLHSTLPNIQNINLKKRSNNATKYKKKKNDINDKGKNKQLLLLKNNIIKEKHDDYYMEHNINSGDDEILSLQTKKTKTLTSIINNEEYQEDQEEEYLYNDDMEYENENENENENDNDDNNVTDDSDYIDDNY